MRRALVLCEGRTVARVAIAGSVWDQLRGLIGCLPVQHGEGMLLPRCNAIHTAGLAGPIDVAFLGSDGRIIQTVSGLRAWRVAVCWRALDTLELAAGTLTAAELVVGDRLEIRAS
jgi:uncharacterized protein